MIEVFKILHGIYDRDITERILQLAQNTRTRGHSLKLTTVIKAGTEKKLFFC